MSNTLRFLQIMAKLSRLSIFYSVFNHKNLILKYLDKALTDFP